MIALVGIPRLKYDNKIIYYPPHRKGIPPAMFHVIADTFSWSGWRHEATVRVLPVCDRKSKRKFQKVLASLDREPPQFLLIETVWENWGRGHRRRKFKQQAVIIGRMIHEYRSRGIPVVFWSKEDPPHFQRFIRWAKQCDLILTTDVGCVPRYRDYGCSSVHPMTFPAQPAIHKNYFPQTKTVCFAGSWNKHHPTRLEGIHNLIDPLMNDGLDIFSRKGSWPEEYLSHIIGSYPYEELLRRYSAYIIGLSISSVRESPTMFPRRVVEMICAGLLVISDRCLGVASLFPEIPQSTSPQQTREIVDYYLTHEADRLELVSSVREKILAEHTYRHRVEYIEALLKQ
ncbi:MAG: glycosyltransferase [Pirellulales bacterium]|nr:glycosyltransferase [Pirellulales bacterium]